MGRKMLTCEIGDIFGCFEVLSSPVVIGEHSFVNVKCLKCGHQSTLALSEIKNRPKQNCTKCRGSDNIKYSIPENNSIIGNWKVLDNTIIKIKGFRCILCECCKCSHNQYIRLDALHTKGKNCDECKAKRVRVKEEIQKEKSKRRQNQPALTKFNQICATAAMRSILVTITPEYIQDLYNKQDKKCALTGDDLPDIRSASLDRIDSDKPYEPGNVQFVTKEANLAKHIMSQEDFINFCRKVVKHADQQLSRPLTKSESSETNS